MINLNNVKLISPLEFLTDQTEQGERPIGIGVKMLSRDGQKERVHYFDTDNHIYQGYFDRDLTDGPRGGLTSRSVRYAYKGRYKKGETYYKTTTEGIKSHRETVLANTLPMLEVGENNVVTLVGFEKLSLVELPETSRELIDRQAKAEGRSPAQIMGERDGSLRNGPSDGEEVEPDETDSGEPTNPEEGPPRRY